LSPGQHVEHALDRNRFAWVQVARGTIELDGTSLVAGDGAALRGPGTLPIRAIDDAELLLFDLP
jgi:redox-sensitive bicupin YhaK (pirin superfamily)